MGEILIHTHIYSGVGKATPLQAHRTLDPSKHKAIVLTHDNHTLQITLLSKKMVTNSRENLCILGS